jgi:hypothetical protein
MKGSLLLGSAMGSGDDVPEFGFEFGWLVENDGFVGGTLDFRMPLRW